MNFLYRAFDYTPGMPLPFLRLVMAGCFAAIIAVGRLYDPRISIASVLISTAYILTLALVTAKVRVTRVPPHVWTLVGVSLVVLVVSLITGTPPYGREKLAVWFTITLPIACAFLLYGEDLLWPYLRALVLIGASLSFLALFEFEPGSRERLALFGGGPIVLARWVCLSLLGVITLPRVPWIARLVIGGLGIPILFAAASRGPMLALAIAVLGYLVLFRRIRILLSAVVPLLVLLFALPNLHHLNLPALQPFSAISSDTSVPGASFSQTIRQLAPSASRLVFLPSQLARQTSFIDRLERLQATGPMLRDHPWGVGIGRWAPYAVEYGYATEDEADYVHNVFLELSAELGLVAGALALVYVLGALILTAFVGRRYRATEAQVLSAFLIYWIVNSSISGDLSDARQLFVMCALGYLFGTRHMRDHPTWVPKLLVRILSTK